MFKDGFRYPAFALFRQPGKNQIGYICSKIPVQNPVFDDSTDNGFVFAPFDHAKHPTYFIPGTPEFMSLEDFDKQAPNLFISDIELAGNNHIKNTVKSDFIEWIQRFKISENKPEIKKIIFSVVMNLSIPNRFDVIRYFKILVHHYPSAYISLFYCKGVGLWIGASPELLVERKGSALQSVALAATKRRDDPANWDQKDFNEFNYVKQYIQSIFDKFNLPELLQSKKPETLFSGPVKHLIQHFKAKLPNPFSLQSFIQDLHPTPAICGFPKKNAFEMIYKNESHDREYYAGYLGLMSPQHTQLFVNIRCAKILPNHLKTIAGVGITKESIPDKEWQEVLDKLNVLKSKLRLV